MGSAKDKHGARERFANEFVYSRRMAVPGPGSRNFDQPSNIYIYMNIRNYCYYIYIHTRVFRVTYDLRTPSLARLGVSRPVNP